MKLINFIKDYKNSKKEYIKTKKIFKLFNKINNKNIDYWHTYIFFMTLFYATPIAFIAIFDVNNIIELLSLFIGNFFLVFIPFFIVLRTLNINKIEKLQPYLKSLLKKRWFFSGKANKRLNNIFEKNIGEKNNIEYVKNIINEIKNKKAEDSYIKNKNKFPNWFFSKNDYIEDYINKSNVNLKDIIIYTINNISIEELRNIKESEINEMLNDFNIEDKIELSNLIKEKLVEEQKNQNILKENLNIINNKKLITQKNHLIQIGN